MFTPGALDPAVDRLVELAGEGRALEFAIGTGRIAIPLAARGVPVTGIELSAPMVEQLRTKVDEHTIGMSIATMRRFAGLRREGEAGRPARLSLLLEHREAVRARLDLLHRNLRKLDLKIARHRRILRQQGAQPVPEHTNVNADEVAFGLLPHPPRATRDPSRRRAPESFLLGGRARRGRAREASRAGGARRVPVPGR